MMDTVYSSTLYVSIRSVGLVRCVVRGTSVRCLSGLQRVLVKWRTSVAMGFSALCVVSLVTAHA